MNQGKRTRKIRIEEYLGQRSKVQVLKKFWGNYPQGSNTLGIHRKTSSNRECKASVHTFPSRSINATGLKMGVLSTL